MYRKYQMARIIEVASLIHKEPCRWTRPRLAARLEVSIATIQRDIDLLCEMGIEIIPRGKQGYEMVSDFFLPALNLNFEEALALVTAARFYQAAEGKQAIEVLNNAIHKITSNLPKRTNETLDRIAPQIEVPHQQISQIDEIEPHRETLYEAIRERRKVNMAYNAFSSGKRERHRLSPYAVLFRKHAWYVIGHVEQLNQILTFRINRIHNLFMSHLSYTIPEDFSVQKYMEKSWDFRLGPETHVVIEFKPRIAPLIREVQWHSTQQIYEQADRGLRFEATVAGWQEVGWWVLTWGEEAEVIQPKELRKWVADTAARMVEVYRKN
ncbi:hypothetical protein C6502_07575 [Candidatus Poribacteria bacterium]|nr:MAG: hypothetical protein C6502_07575 [Candidatus Poribacteria bacterium]